MQEITIIDGSKTFTWLDNGGDRTIHGKPEGFDYPPIRPVYVNIPGRSGSVFVNSMYGGRRLSWVGDLLGDDVFELRRMMLSPMSQNPKILKFTTYDGLQLQANIQAVRVVNPYTHSIHTYMIEVYADDWRLFSQNESSIQTGSTQIIGGFEIPFELPLAIESLGSPNIFTVNTGDEFTSPTIRIDGPGNNFIVQNITTGQILRVNLTLLGNEHVIVDTRAKTAKKGGTQNVFGTIFGNGPDWFKIIPGTNEIYFSANSGTSDDTLLTLSYRSAYLGV